MNLNTLALQPMSEGYSFIIITDEALLQQPAWVRLLFYSWIQEAEDIAAEYGGLGDWSIGVFSQTTRKQQQLFNNCWLRVPLYGANVLKPGYGTHATKLDGRTTQHRATWSGTYICAFMRLTVD